MHGSGRWTFEGTLAADGLQGQILLCIAWGGEGDNKDAADNDKLGDPIIYFHFAWLTSEPLPKVTLLAYTLYNSSRNPKISSQWS